MSETVTISVNTASIKHPLIGGDLSRAGHMWFTLPEGGEFGFGPEGVTYDDSGVYSPS